MTRRRDNRSKANLKHDAEDVIRSFTLADAEGSDLPSHSSRSAATWREAENRYRRLLADMSAIIFELDGDGIVQFVNDSIGRLTGYEATNLKGKNWWNVFFPESERHQVVDLYQLFESGDVVNHEMTIQHRDGSNRTLELNFAIDRHSDGRVQAILGFGVDISERKAAEIGLAEHARRFELLAEVSRTFGEAGLDYAHSLSTVARRITDLIGDICIIRLLSEDGNWLETATTYHPDDQASATLKRILASKRSSKDPFLESVITDRLPLAIEITANKPHTFPAEEEEIVNHFGVRNWLVVPLRADDRIIGTMEVLGLDTQRSYSRKDLRFLQELADRAALTIINARLFGSAQHELRERRRAEQAHERLISIMEATSDQIAILGNNRKLQYANRAARKALGIEPNADVSDLGLPCPTWVRELLDKEAIPTTYRDGQWKGQTAYVDEHGRERPLSHVLIAHRNTAGEVEFISSIARDIGDLRQFEQELLRSQKMEAVGKLAGGIAHDFNNLLTIISGNAALLLQQPDTEHAFRSKIESIKQAADRSAALTRQLLAFSKPKVFHPRLLAFSDIVNGIRSVVTSLSGEEIQVSTFISGDVGYVKADPSQMDQIILNLAMNARDAMPSGGQLSIEVRNVDISEASAHKHADLKPGQYVLLTVSDTGGGMDAVTASRIFEPFFTTKEFGKGTGLGLFTVYGIVQQYGGHITVQSQIGQGTKFRIYLPRMATGMREDVPLSSVRSSETKTLLGGNETILVVEDESELRKFVSDCLRADGYRVLEAADGENALQVVTAYDAEIRLVITDLVMPRMNGLKLAEHLRASHPKARVLYMSGHAERALEPEASFEPNTNFIEKPFDLDTLRAKVRSILDNIP